MQSPSASTPKVSSPPKGNSRVEDGKIKKLKSTSKSDTSAIQHINGKTYACESCKRGHRVNKCDHGKTRPISETNQPGRPSAGQKRGCHCPRNCACTTKTCKCERDCACTQEMFLIVRLDKPVVINRESTPTPKPVWEDADGNRLTLKKVWADANGKEIDDEEYQARKRRMKEREEAAKDTPKSSCCGSKTPKEEPESPKGGCRHRQNVAAIQPHPGPSIPEAIPQLNSLKPPAEPWMSTCSCGSGCSCLYCPDHPNNATSINHAQQQVKNLAEQAYTGGHALTPVTSISESNSRSCMGGQPSFFLSNTPAVSHDQLQQFFSDTLNPNAIYLAYPIQQHSWTNRPLSSHCSHVHSPPAGPMPTPQDNQALYTDSLSDISTSLLSNEDMGTWNFPGSELGGSSFSWTGLDASYGTDYNIGQATIASISNTPPSVFQPSTTQQAPPIHINSTTISSTEPPGLPLMPEFQDPIVQLQESSFPTFNIPDSSDPALDVDIFASDPLPTFNTQPAQNNCCTSQQWVDFDLLHDPQTDSEFNVNGTPRTHSPIMNHA